MSNGEVRITNALTGGEKGSKVARFDLIPASPLWQLAEHYGKGAEKYEDRNWEKGYDWSLSFAAMMRHAWAFWNGEDIDPETGSHHLAAVAFHAFAMMEWGDTHPEMDNRPSSKHKYDPDKTAYTLTMNQDLRIIDSGPITVHPVGQDMDEIRSEAPSKKSNNLKKAMALLSDRDLYRVDT